MMKEPAEREIDGEALEWPNAGYRTDINPAILM